MVKVTGILLVVVEGKDPLSSIVNTKVVEVAMAVLWVVNTLRPRQNGRHFADDTFNRIFVIENV